MQKRGEGEVAVSIYNICILLLGFVTCMGSGLQNTEWCEKDEVGRKEEKDDVARMKSR